MILINVKALIVIEEPCMVLLVKTDCHLVTNRFISSWDNLGIKAPGCLILKLQSMGH